MRRFTYEEVDEYPGRPQGLAEQADAAGLRSCSADMHELAMILRKRRLDGGAIELTLPEVKIDLDNERQGDRAHLVENTESHQIIEEFMLAANEAVAESLRPRRVPLPPPRARAAGSAEAAGADRVRQRAGHRMRRAWKAASRSSG